MAGNPSTLSRVRTFRDDFARAEAKSGSKTSALKPAQSAAPAAAASKPVIKENLVAETPALKPQPKPTPVPTAPVVKHVAIEVTPPRKKPVDTPILTTPKQPAAPKTNLAADLSKIASDDRQSLLNNEGKTFSMVEESQPVAEGSIITDQKRERFKLWPAMISAFKDWFGAKEEEVAELVRKKPPVATVRPAADRQEVIRKAAEKSAVAPKDDYSKLSSRVSESGRKPVASKTGGLRIKKRSEVPPPSWTHTVGEPEPVKPIAPTPTPQSEMVQEPVISVRPEVARPQPTETVPVVEPKPVPPPPPIPEPAPVPTPPPAPAPEPVPEPVPPPAPEPIPEPTPEPEPTPTEPVAEPATPAPNAAPPTSPEVAPYAPPPSAVQPVAAGAGQSELVFSPWRIGAVVLVAVILGVSLSIWLFGGDKSEYTLQNQEVSNSLISGEERIAVPLGTNAQVFMRNILSVQPKPTTVVAEIYPTGDVAGDTEEVSTEQVVTVLDWQAPGSFLRNITDINFGLYRDREPFMVLKVNSFDTAFGGILEWEKKYEC